MSLNRIDRAMRSAPATQAELRALLAYDETTGVFYWRSTHRKMKKSLVGKPAGRLLNGYVMIVVNGVQTGAHRLAWLYVYGEWPPNHVDHINRTKDDNRIDNLRLATPSDNQANKKKQSNSRTRLKGVARVGNKFTASIKRNGISSYLGIFASEEEAHEAYMKAAVVIHGEFARSA